MVFTVFYNIILSIIQCALFVQCTALLHVDHFERCTQKCDNEWKRSSNDNIQDLGSEEIVPCVVEGTQDLLVALLFLNYLTQMVLKQNLTNYFRDRLYLF